jgi:hypothetical protein
VSTTVHRPDMHTSSAAYARAPRSHGRRLALLVGGLAIVTIGAALAWNRPQDATPVPAPADLAAYAAGGSVYGEQVPSSGTAPDQSAYAAGGSVYAEQVPSSATSWVTAYGPQGLVHSEHVPAGASWHWVAGYGTGSTTYAEQVPTTGRR